MAVAFLAKGTMGQSSTGSVSVAFTVPKIGPNRCIFIPVLYDNTNGLTITAVTYGGQACTLAGPVDQNTNNNSYAAVYYLVNPPTGSNTLSITSAGGATDIYYNVITFNGVNQSTPIRAGTYQNPANPVTNSGGTFSLTVTSDTHDITLTAVNGGSGTVNVTNQTSDGNSSAGTFSAGSDHCTTPASSVTHTWSGGATSQLAIVGFSIQWDGLTTQSLTLFAANPIQGGSNAGLLTLSAPTASTSTTGWTVGTKGPGNYSLQSYNNKQASTAFGTTVLPNAAPVNLAQDCWRLSAQTTGTFSDGTWYSSLSVIAVTAASQRGAALVRLWRSTNADGTSATEITKSRMTGGTLASNLLTTAAQSSSASTFIAQFSLSNEYLFMQVAWSSTTTATSASADVVIRMGNMAQTSGSGLITSIFSSTGGGGGGGSPSGQYYYSMMADWFNR